MKKTNRGKLGYTLKCDGELWPMWFQTNRKVLKEESHALTWPHGSAKIVKVRMIVKEVFPRKKK